MRLYTGSYSNAYVPAMPMVELGVSRPGSRQPDQTVAAVIDSGADGTLLPIDILETVGAGYVGEAIIREISGAGQHVSISSPVFMLAPKRYTPFGLWRSPKDPS